MDKLEESLTRNAVIGIKTRRPEDGIGQFFDRYYETELSKDFQVYRLSLDALRAHIQEHVVEHGLSSLFYNHIICDAVTHPGFKTDEIEAIVVGMMGKLDGVKHLLIIDAFFYSNDPSTLTLLERIISSLSSNLEKVTIITNGSRAAHKPGIHGAIYAVAPAVQITDVVTGVFHDRFWIDADREKGLVVGTSLNGIGKKLAMIDYPSRGDIREIMQVAAPFL